MNDAVTAGTVVFPVADAGVRDDADRADGEAPGSLTADCLALFQWLSPAFPVGAFAWSHGLEAAIARGDVTTADTLADWLDGIVRFGAGWTDAVLLAATHRGAAPEGEIAALAAALAPSRERRAETLEQGAAFARTIASLSGATRDAAAYPVAVGQAARALSLPTQMIAALYLQAIASNLVHAAVRFVPLGQTDGQRVLARLAPVIEATAQAAAHAPLEALGGAGFRSDIAAMTHETMTTRIFRS